MAARAAAFNPNETLLTPRDVNTPGSAALIWRMPSIVSMADPAMSSAPVANVNVSVSKISESGVRPYSFTAMS